MRDVSGEVTSSAMLINYLDNGRDISCLAEHQEMITAKKMHHHVKMFDTNDSIDVLVGNVEFPEHDIAHDECFSNVDIAPTGMFDLKLSNLSLRKCHGLLKISF